jgi:hypothetical protein
MTILIKQVSVRIENAQAEYVWEDRDDKGIVLRHGRRQFTVVGPAIDLLVKAAAANLDAVMLDTEPQNLDALFAARDAAKAQQAAAEQARATLDAEIATKRAELAAMAPSAEVVAAEPAVRVP